MKKLILLAILSISAFGQVVTNPGTGSVPNATATTPGKSVLGQIAPVATASLGTCAAGNRGQIKQVTDGSKGTRICTLTTGSTYAWINNNPPTNILNYGVTNAGTDTASALTSALAAATSGDVLYFPRGTYNLATTTFTWPSGVDAIFEGAVFSSTATTGTIFTISSNVTWVGNVTIKRASSSSTNEVTLVQISGVTNVSLGNMSLENAHLGLVVQNSSYVTTGTIKGANIDGQYSGGAPGGDLLGIVDVQNSSFGDVLGTEIAKVAVYFGVDGSLTQTENVQVGNITATLTTGKCCGAALSIRNGKKVSIGNVIAVGGYRGVVVQHETGDTAALEDIQIGNITARDQATSGAFALVSALNGGSTILNLHVGNIIAGNGTGGAVSLAGVSGGSIGNIWAKTFSTGAETVLLNTVNDFTIGDIYVEDVQYTGVYVLTGTRVNLGNIYVKNNSRAASASYGVVFDTCTYTQALDVVAENTSGTGHSRPLQSIANTTNKVRSCSSIGTTTDGTCALNGTAFASVREYRLFRSAVPTAGTWALGDIVYNSAPTALGVMGWIVTTAGTPGTWSAFYANNQATGTTSSPTFSAIMAASLSASGSVSGGSFSTSGTSALAAITGTDMRISSAPDTNGIILRSAGNSLRWVIRGEGTESGSNAGYNLVFNSRNDSQASLGNALTITRSSLLSTFGGVVKASGGGISFSNIAFSSTAPTVTSAGTSPSITASNGTAAFEVNVGTGGTATTIVLAMPTATTGWNCHATNVTATAANRADQAVRQTASTTTSVTLQNQTVSTGAALAFTASDLVRCQCTAY